MSINPGIFKAYDIRGLYPSEINEEGTHLIGRGFARFLTTTLSVIVALGFGIAFLKLQLNPADVRWGLFAATLCIGVVLLAMMGLALARWRAYTVIRWGFSTR